MDEEKLNRIAELSKRTNQVTDDLYAWEKEGRRIKSECAKINTALLQEFRDEAAKNT